jgi:hypothetical protein
MCVLPIGPGSPGRSERGRIVGWDPPPDGGRADHGSTRPGMRPLSAYRYLRFLAYVAVARRCLSRSAFVAPASALAFSWISSIGLPNVPAQGRDEDPSLGRG